MQAVDDAGGNPREVTTDVAARVRSMMLLYDALYHKDRNSELGLRGFLLPLVNDIQSLFPIVSSVLASNYSISVSEIMESPPLSRREGRATPQPWSASPHHRITALVPTPPDRKR